MALLMVRTVCLLVYAALEYRSRKALKDSPTTFPNQKGQLGQNPTARRVLPAGSCSIVEASISCVSVGRAPAY